MVTTLRAYRSPHTRIVLLTTRSVSLGELGSWPGGRHHCPVGEPAGRQHDRARLVGLGLGHRRQHPDSPGSRPRQTRRPRRHNHVTARPEQAVVAAHSAVCSTGSPASAGRPGQSRPAQSEHHRVRRSGPIRQCSRMPGRTFSISISAYSVRSASGRVVARTNGSAAAVASRQAVSAAAEIAAYPVHGSGGGTVPPGVAIRR
jgi:hypothetical protein